MKHFSHEHVLELGELRPEFVTDFICQICNRSFAQDGPRCYSCISCFYVIHKKCGELPQHINHSLHPLHPLTLANRPFSKDTTSSSCCYLFCDKPFEFNEGYTYACEQCSDFHMHRECAMIPLPTLITSSSDDGGQPADQNFVQYACHQNPLILVEHDHHGGRKGKSAQCFACHEIWSAPAYSCTSNECENFLHKSCADLKPKIYHPFHSRHPLKLQIMEVINDQERRDVELTALGEHRWYMGHHTEGNTEEKFTLNDIFDNLHPAEKAMLIDPLGFNNPAEKLPYRNAYDFYRRLNSRFDIEGSIEDIDRIQSFFYFEEDDDGLNSFWWELLLFVHEEGLKIEDKYLRQNVENVDGYLVPKTLAPILRTFISENEDLEMAESLTLEMKSIIATLFSIVIDRMYRTKFEDVTWNDLQHWIFYLKSITQIKGSDFRILFSSRWFKEFMRPFLGLEAIRREKNAIKKLHSRIAELEADLERCKGLLEKAKGYDKSQASEYMKKGLEEASEFKQKSCGELRFGW